MEVTVFTEENDELGVACGMSPGHPDSRKKLNLKLVKQQPDSAPDDFDLVYGATPLHARSLQQTCPQNFAHHQTSHC